MPLVSFNDDKDVTSTFNAKDVEGGVWFNKWEASRIAEDCATMPGTDYAYRWNTATSVFEELQEGDGDGPVWVPVKTKRDEDGQLMFYMGEDWEWRTVPRPDEDPEDEWQMERVSDWDALATAVVTAMTEHRAKFSDGELHYEIGEF